VVLLSVRINHTTTTTTVSLQFKSFQGNLGS
jgi:hypothetical protein